VVINFLLPCYSVCLGLVNGIVVVSYPIIYP
jgi:hypothetical protein